MNNIRNFCIIAHIDHGKSTLADRMLEITDTIPQRDMKEQVLDQLDLERERGITIKLAPVRMVWKNYILNLIDTPGHVDFAYEVSRSLAAVEGAVLLVDATQGIEAQTLSVLYAAIEDNLTIIPVVNKIDLPAARPKETAGEIVKILGCKEEEIIYASGKTGEGVKEILERIIEVVPPPHSPDIEELETKALIFDSVYDSYRGVVAYIRVFSGQIRQEDKFLMMANKSEGEILEVGYFSPKFQPHSPISVGEIGYVVTGFKKLSEAQVGDTITLKANPACSPLPGYKKILPLVFASIFCSDGADYPRLKEAIEKLKLNDSALFFEPERSDALGFGFRCGFLGLLHLDIVRERLEREYDLSLIISAPTVEYYVATEQDDSNSKNHNLSTDGGQSESYKFFQGSNFLTLAELKEQKYRKISKPLDFSTSLGSFQIFEPIVNLEIFTPKEYIGGIMEMIKGKRADFLTMEYLEESRLILKYEIPLAEVIVDLYDLIKSLSKGYASMNYEVCGFRSADLKRVDILVAEKQIEALSFIAHRSKAVSQAKRIVEKLKSLIPRQNFEIKLQAALGAKIIAAERIPPFRKDVTAKLYGGDVTRKNKLLERQKKGKKKMKQIGHLEMPSDVFTNVFRNN